jgi:hypothetical protein
MLFTQSESLNDHRINPFKWLDSQHFHSFAASHTLKLLDHEVRLPHLNTKYCYPVFSDLFPKHLMKEKSMLFHVHPLPTRSKLQFLLSSSYRKHGFALNPSLKEQTSKQLFKQRKRTFNEINSDEDLSIVKRQKQTNEEIFNEGHNSIELSALNKSNEANEVRANEEFNVNQEEEELLGAIPENSAANEDERMKHTEILLAQEDESAIMAGVDVEIPSFELLDYIREIAAMKLPLRNVQTQKINAEDLVHVLERKFSSSALVAIGIFVEEIIREQMKIWYQSGYPLLFIDDENHQTLKAAIRSQASGSPYLEDDLIIGLLKNRLEVM